MLGKDGWEDPKGALYYQAGHFGIEKTRELVARKYYWETCSCYQYLPIAGRTYRWISRRDCLYLRIGRALDLLLLPIPTLCWKDLSLDFVTGLPISTDWKVTSHNSILVIVDRLTRWKDLLMDFVTGLPISTDWKGTSYDLILVIVNRLTKMVHYEPV